MIIFLQFFAVLRIRDLVLWPLDSEWEKNLDPGSGMNIEDRFCVSLETIFRGKYSYIFNADPDSGSGFFLTLDPGSGMEKFGSGIWDKHLESATLVFFISSCFSATYWGYRRVRRWKRDVRGSSNRLAGQDGHARCRPCGEKSWRGQLHSPLPGTSYCYVSWTSRSVIICMDPDPDLGTDLGLDSGSFIHPAKIVRKTLISTVLWLLYEFLSLKIKNDLNVPSKIKQQRNFKKFIFCWILKVTDEQSRIRKSVILIRGSGTIPKCHGSTTLPLKSVGISVFTHFSVNKVFVS